jgi:putative MATE family efflux protein
LRLALPVLAEQVLHMLVGFSDTWLAGQFMGPAEIAAMGIMNYLLWFHYVLFGLVGIGATAMVARFVGAGDPVSARRVVHQALLLGAVLAAIVTSAGITWAADFVHLLELRGDAAARVTRFLSIYLWATPVIMLQEVGIACLRGAGDTVSGLITMVVVNLVNITVSWSLVLGWGPFPELGWDGLAIGTTTASVVGGLTMLGWLVHGRAGLRLAARELTPDISLMRRLLRIGLPGGADTLAIVGCHLAYVSIINSLGEQATAAHGIGVRIESVTYLPGFAFQVAAATMVGQYLGAKDVRRARRAVLDALVVGGGVMMAAGVFLYVAPGAITRFFLRDDQGGVIDLTARLLPIVAAAIPALAVISIFSGALRGAGDTRVPIIFTFVGLVLVRLPLAAYLAHASFTLPLVETTFAGRDLGVAGAWYAMVIDVTLRCVLFTARYFHGGWSRVEV